MKETSPMEDIKARLLPAKPSPVLNPRDASYRASPFARQPFQGVDVLGLKKRGQGLRSWIRVDAATGDSQVIEVDKFTMMRRCDLPARDLRLLDPLFVYPSTILGREKAIVVNLEQIRCIITSDEVLLLNSLDSYVLQYVVELQRRLKAGGADDVWQSESSDFNRRRGGRTFRDMFGGTSADYLPFEFKALEVALEAACFPKYKQGFPYLDASELEIEAYPLLDELTSKISTANLERVRDEIEQLMDDDGDMAEMYLTEKKRRMDSLFYGEQSIPGYRSVDGGLSISAPVSPLKEYIDDTEDFINIQLDNVRNQLIQFELLLTTGTFVVAIFGVVAGIFGMNFQITLFDSPSAFKWVLIITGVSGAILFGSFLWFFKHRRLMPL
ncbi:Magnesium transporter MRS2/LPE10 [Cynara cardunculus var. scolymus]|uniref:Magnesium transporter n=1 Tax=Cynara cardunculus var. scolymus TaxID=59895 RepID=A0A103XY20_CYNCS|nr:Magnesium transporter MRS2/LPE10 [Cynara cardunculus var. scolymus]